MIHVESSAECIHANNPNACNPAKPGVADEL
jgi:hypothetical protein